MGGAAVLPLQELLTVDFGGPLHSLVLVGETDVIEEEMLKFYGLKPDTPRLPATVATDHGSGDDE